MLAKVRIKIQKLKTSFYFDFSNASLNVNDKFFQTLIFLYFINQIKFCFCFFILLIKFCFDLIECGGKLTHSFDYVMSCFDLFAHVLLFKQKLYIYCQSFEKVILDCYKTTIKSKDEILLACCFCCHLFCWIFKS